MSEYEKTVNEIRSLPAIMGRETPMDFQHFAPKPTVIRINKAKIGKLLQASVRSPRYPAQSTRSTYRNSFKSCPPEYETVETFARKSPLKHSPLEGHKYKHVKNCYDCFLKDKIIKHMEKILIETKASPHKIRESGRASIESSYENRVLENYERMLRHLKYYRAFSQQETQFIDFVEKLNKLETENKELRLKCAETNRLLTLREETNMSRICKVKKESRSEGNEETVDKLLGLLSTLNKTLSGIETVLDSPNTEKELKQLNLKQWKSKANNSETEKRTQMQIEKLRKAIQESKEKLSDSLNFLIDSLTK